MTRTHLIGLLLALSSLYPAPVLAAIIGVTGEGLVMVPDALNPVSLNPNAFEDLNPVIRAWNEVQDFTLDRPVAVDFDGTPGFFGEAGRTSLDGILDLGLRISSHVFFQDPLNEGGRNTATFFFDGIIVGIIANGDRLDGDRFLLADFLANPFSDAPGVHVNDRGLEFGPERLTVSDDRRALTMFLQSGSPGDQVRVITLSAPVPVPEPSSMLLLGSGLLAIGHRVRSRMRKTPR